ncbi:MAG TPA: hypothetical protein VLJ79_11225 [Candidatus Binatia bacterium]|nr:hypothetical protein [Candidatus Binatia bacterium]
MDGGGIIAVGPRAADLIAKGIVFETDLKDEAFAIVDDRLSPKGYAYRMTGGAYAEHSRYHVVPGHFYDG